MKKKLLVLVMTGMMAASVLTACGDKEAAAPAATETAAAAESTVEASTPAETTEAATSEAATTEATTGEDKALTNFDEYLGWTGTEWSAASDEEKLNAAIAYSVYTTEAITGESFDAETKALTVEQMRIAEDIQDVVDQLDSTLPSFPDSSIKDLADEGVKQINSLMEAATETEAN